MLSHFRRAISLRKIVRAPLIVRALFVQQFLEGFVPIAALYAIMFERAGGLNFSQIGWLFAAWALAYLIGELPSGVLADYWSRKKVIMIGGLLRAAGFVLWLGWPTFWGYTAGFMLWGLSLACSSGAVAAYLHTELQAIQKGAQYAKFYGWITSAFWVGMLASNVVAAILTLDNASWLIWLSIASSVIYTGLLFFLTEQPYARQDTYFKTLAAGFRQVRQSKKLRYTCYVLFSVYMIIGVLEELLPRVFASFGLGDSAIALILALAIVLTVLLLTRLESFVHVSLTKQGLTMAAAIVCLLLGLWAGGAWGVGLVLLFSLLFHVFRPVFIHHVQQAAEGEERATIGSIPGLAAGLLSAVVYGLMGWVASFTSEVISIALYSGAWLIIVCALAYMGRQYGTIASMHVTEQQAAAKDAMTGQPKTQL